MYLIAGLGNPGTKFEMTRHNIGFHTIDYIADKTGIKVKKLKYKALFGEGEINGEKVLLVKPQTYMNLSGESLIDFVRFYKIPVSNVIVISDDIALPTGRIRIRQKGSAGGHNGLKSIIYMLGSDEFCRVRIGVGAPEDERYELKDFVLGRFTKDEIPVLERSITNAALAVEEIIANNAQCAMNKFNGE